MIRRREFITVLGGAAVWPLVARAQQPAMPVIGFLHSQPPDALSSRMESLRQGLRDMGYTEGENVAIEYRWAENQIDRLPALAADLVRQQVAVIAVVSEPATLAAKAATKTIPIVFGVANDPVMLGLVSSLARPGGNLTGINFFTAELTTKRLELLRELLPSMKRVAVLINPTNAALTEPALKDVQAAGRAMGLEIHLYNASTSREINTAFASLAGERPDALFVGPDPLYVSRRVQLTQSSCATSSRAAGIANDIVREDIMPQNQPFEIPQQLRELAERNVEQARTAYGQLMDAMAQATGMWMSAMRSKEGTSGFKVVQERAIQFAKQNAEACFAAASELANAKDIQDLLAIQSRSAQTQMQAYALQAQELGRLMVEAAQSVQPRS